VETPEAQKMGLSGRLIMPDDYGMLFKSATSFWMKDCHFSLDAAFLDESGRILDIQHMEKESYPKSFKSQAEETTVCSIELPAGWCAANDVTRGDVISLVN
jgi:uncharacterized membrane protein (UPF0127 family)